MGQMHTVLRRGPRYNDTAICGGEGRKSVPGAAEGGSAVLIRAGLLKTVHHNENSTARLQGRADIRSYVRRMLRHGRHAPTDIHRRRSI